MSGPNRTTVEDVLASLSSFNRDQLAQIESKIRFLKSSNGAVTAPSISEVDDELLLFAITDFLSSNGLEQISREVLKRSQGYKAFCDKVPALVRYFDKAAGKLSRLEKIAMYREAIGLLYKNMVDVGIAVSSRTLMAHAHRIPSVMNKSFPGYAKIGMLHLAVKEKRNGHTASK